MIIIEILKAIVFGIVEGLTEWLPVSSTGHMIILNQLMPLVVGDNAEEFYSMFQVVIQLGAILAVVVIFWDRIWPFSRENNDYPLAEEGFGAMVRMDVINLWLHILVSCVPAAIVGVLFDDQLEALFYNYQTVAIMLITFGIAFIIIETFHKGVRPKVKGVANIDYKVAFLIGMFQLIAAIFPGTSRSGATILGALLLGVSRTTAATYTFYLAIPVMFGASLLKLIKFGFAFSAVQILVLLIGMAVAFVVSMAVIRFLLGYVRKHDFKAFGVYRILLGILVLILGLVGII